MEQWHWQRISGHGLRMNAYRNMHFLCPPFIQEIAMPKIKLIFMIVEWVIDLSTWKMD